MNYRRGPSSSDSITVSYQHYGIPSNQIMTKYDVNNNKSRVEQTQSTEHILNLESDAGGEK